MGGGSKYLNLLPEKVHIRKRHLNRKLKRLSEVLLFKDEKKKVEIEIGDKDRNHNV